MDNFCWIQITLEYLNTRLFFNFMFLHINLSLITCNKANLVQYGWTFYHFLVAFNTSHFLSFGCITNCAYYFLTHKWPCKIVHIRFMSMAMVERFTINHIPIHFNHFTYRIDVFGRYISWWMTFTKFINGIITAKLKLSISALNCG